MAGRMSTPVGTIIFTGAFATASWRRALYPLRASRAASSKLSAIVAPKRRERTMFSITTIESSTKRPSAMMSA